MQLSGTAFWVFYLGHQSMMQWCDDVTCYNVQRWPQSALPPASNFWFWLDTWQPSLPPLVLRQSQNTNAVHATSFFLFILMPRCMSIGGTWYARTPVFNFWVLLLLFFRPWTLEDEDPSPAFSLQSVQMNRHRTAQDLWFDTSSYDTAQSYLQRTTKHIKQQAPTLFELQILF